MESIDSSLLPFVPMETVSDATVARWFGDVIYLFLHSPIVSFYLVFSIFGDSTLHYLIRQKVDLADPKVFYLQEASCAVINRNPAINAYMREYFHRLE